MGIASQNSTTKLSVIHNDTIAIIHIYFKYANACIAKCQNGECIARLQHKKKIVKTASNKKSSENHCGHIQTLFANFEIVSELFPHYFVANDASDEENEDHVVQQVCADYINAEDEPVHRVSEQESQGFDVNTGLWKFDSRSNHKPRDMPDLHLTRYAT